MKKEQRNFVGALVSAACVTFLLFGRLAPFSGVVGLVVVAFPVFIATYALLTWLDGDGPSVVDKVMTVLLTSAAAVVGSGLVWVVGSTLWKGRNAIRHASNLFAEDMSRAGPLDPLSTGGIKHAILGTLLQITVALLITVPLGLCCAVYLNESRSRASKLVRTIVEAMTALPSVVAGLFIFATWILILGNERSSLAASFAISVMMLPIIIRSADVVLRLVPGNLREASAALGAPSWRTVWHVVLPTARSGLATSIILGTARGVGETSPVLLTAGFTAALNLDPLHGPMVSLPLATFEFINSPSPAMKERGFATAGVLMALVLILFVIARILGGRGPGRLTPRQARRAEARSARDLARFQAMAGTALAIVAALAVVAIVFAPKALAENYVRISGEGSSWAANAIDAMRVNVKQFGITVDYNPTGSTAGRKNFLNGTVDFAASDIPFQFQPEDGSAPENPAPGSYAYMPITAGGTAFMYNLKIGGQRVTNLRLSGENVAKIFSGVITKWNDPALKADNPGLELPDRKVVPVVRSDGSGSTAQFSRWFIRQHGAIWNDYCNRSGRAPKCGQTSFYPTIPGMIAQAGDLGVAGYVSQAFAEGAIGYVNYSYALGSRFPVAKVLNRAGYYTEPTPENVAVSLLRARINTDQSSPDYLTQQLDDVYTDSDSRNYQLSSYSYLILPTKVQGQFNADKGKTLGAFSYYAMCQAQEQSASLGYSPMPINLVQASFDQIRKIPGVVVQDINIQSCKNPTFSADGTNVLAKNAPQPQPCDKQGPTQCETGTAGARQTATKVKESASAANAGGGAAAGSGGGPAGGATGAAGGSSATASADGIAGPLAAGCDPESGACETALGGVGETAGNLPRDASGTSTLIGASSGWSGQQVLMVIALMMAVGAVLGPAFTWRVLHPEVARPSGNPPPSR